MKHTRPKGTRDILPPESARKQLCEAVFRRWAELHGFREAITPTFEHTDVFVKSSGVTSDVVTKEMYNFKDRSERDLTLRPEGTPGIVRAVLEEKLRIPCRLYYVGPMFRYSRPQKGRFREFYQLGVESFGEASPDVDAEVVALGAGFFAALGVSDCETQINSIGCRTCRPGYNEKLKGFLAAHAAELCAECQVRREQNPLRTFDCKSEACQQVLTAAPRARDSLCPDCAGHFQAVLDGLKQRGVDYVFNDRLVRGLDYYCRTAFEYIAGSIGAQDSLGGGGRYDYLVEDFGGPATPAIGFALGEERALLAAGPSAAADTRRLVFVIAMSDNERAAAIALLQELRQAGIAARMDYEHRKPKSQFHAADSAGAQYCVILGSDELAQGQVSLKDLKTGEQQKLTRAELMARLTTDR